MDEHLKLDSVVLRAVAENAASHRAFGGDPGFMVTTFDRVEGWSTYFTREVPSPSVEAVVTPVNTHALATRPEVEKVTIQAVGMEEPADLTDYDAVFWSESSVEKFVMPYYASKGQWLAAFILAALSRAFYGYVPEPPVFATDGAAGVGGDELPFALAHLPRSDYVGVGEIVPLVDDLHVLLIKDGGLMARPLSDYFPR